MKGIFLADREFFRNFAHMRRKTREGAKRRLREGLDGSNEGIREDTIIGVFLRKLAFLLGQIIRFREEISNFASSIERILCQ